MIENGKNRHTVWLTDEAWNMVGGEYKADGCSTQNEYIEKAIRFYTGYRKTDVKLDAVLEQEKQSGENAAQKAKSSLRASNPAVVPGLAARDDEEEWPDYDVLLREAVRIAADWVEMLDDKGNPAAGTETAAARPAVAE